MAKASWLTCDPMSGSGNGSINNSATVHTGREVRSCTVTVTAAGATSPATYQVTQKAKAEFASYNDGPECSAPKTGGPLAIKGKSNSTALTFEWVGANHEVELPATYKVNGGSATNNGEAIDGDPGASAEYEFQVDLTLPANETVEEVERVLKVNTAGGQSAQITIKQAAGDPTISVDPTTITLEADGSAVSVTVKSNTTWTVS